MRHTDWQTRLSDVMRARQAQPFAWGSHDCVTFAAECVLAVTGVDRIADVRDAWKDDRQAMRLLAEHGGLFMAVADRLGPPMQSPALAQPGDIGVCMQGYREALCVCGGVNWHMPAESGLATLSAEQVVCAWGCEGT